MNKENFYDMGQNAAATGYTGSNCGPTPVTKPSFKQGENTMAEVDTMMLSAEHSDIRREAVEHTNEIVKESIKGDWNVERAVKDARHDGLVATDAVGDRMTTQIDKQMYRIEARDFDSARDLANLRSTIDVGQTMIMGGVAAAAAASAREMEIAVLKNTIESQKNTAYLGDKIGYEGDRTRALINDLKYHDLSRGIIERTAELVELRNDRDDWRHRHGQDQWGAQFAAMQNQLQSMNQNFNSQLSETRQGMVNFGTMAGVGQTSSANNVR